MTYKELAAVFSANPRDVKTAPITNKQPVWFYTYSKEGTIFVDRAKEKTPSSRITSKRRLQEAEFEKVFSIYQKRKCGKAMSVEATHSTVNQVYWFGIFTEMNL